MGFLFKDPYTYIVNHVKGSRKSLKKVPWVCRGTPTPVLNRKIVNLTTVLRRMDLLETKVPLTPFLNENDKNVFSVTPTFSITDKSPFMSKRNRESGM